MKTYKFYVADEFEIEMLELMQKHKYVGLFWPHSPKDTYNFEVDATETDMLAIMLQVPCKLVHN